MPLLPARKARAYEGPECPYCTTTLSLGQCVTGQVTCPRCRKAFAATAFAPVVTGDAGPRSLETAGPDAATPCAVHPGNVAEAACERCGTFICGLCRVDVEGRTLCAACFDQQSTAGALQSAVLTTPDWRNMTYTLTLAGFIPYLGALGSLGALYYGFRGVRAKKAAGEAGETTGMKIAMVLAVLQLVGIAVLTLALVIE